MAPKDDRRIRADRILQAALELGRRERETLLDESCGDDAELRQLVERLIANIEGEDTELMPGGGMQGPLWDGLVEELEGDDEEVATAGTVIGRYRLVRQIGSGGMAVVYLAERADGQFEQQVALKRIRRGIDTRDMILRFDQERQILALAKHPHIAQLIDGGVAPDGRPYFVMEYVEGRSIDHFCDEERLSVTGRLKLFLQVARAIDYAHRNLVVHRDIKPSNILVTHDGHAKLLDFGIAKLLDSDAAPGETPLTRSYTRLMTPVYASPEQVRGQPVTTASDIYQLGLLLYELLTGRWPYHLVEHRPVAVARAIVEDEPTRPSTALYDSSTIPEERPRLSPEEISDARGTSAARLKRELSGDLDNIALTALRKEPVRRYGAVAQMIDDVESFLEGRPVSARSDSLGYRLEKFVKRNKVAVSVAAFALVALALLAVFYTFQLARERDRARLSAARAGQVSDFLSGLFEVSAPTRSKGELITARQLLDQGAARIETELSGQSELQAAMMTLMGNVYRELALYDEARPLLDQAVALRRENPGRGGIDLAESLHALGRLDEDEGRHDAARAHFEEALAIHERALGPAHPDVAGDLSGLGRVLEMQAAYEQARRLQERALTIYQDALGPERPEVGLTLLSLGQVLQRTRRFDDAKARFERALEILEHWYQPDHPYVADARVALAGALRSTGDAVGARAQYETALPLLERVYGPDHPEVAAALDTLGKLLNAADDRDAAIARHRRALAIREGAFGPDHPQVASSLNNLGLAYWGKKDLERAEECFERSAEVFEAAYGPQHVDVSKPLSSLAAIHEDTGDLEDAVALYERVVKIRERAVGADHSLLTRPLANLGTLHMRLGRPDAAEPLLRRALALGRDRDPYRHPEVIWPRLNLAQCLTALARYEEAEALLRETAAESDLAPPAQLRLRENLKALYEAWGKPDRAERYRSEAAA